VQLARFAPAFGKEPRSAAIRRPGFRVWPHAFDRRGPAEEPPSTRIGIDEALRHDDAVLLPVLEDIAERVPHLARVFEVDAVIAIAPDLAAPSKEAIQAPRERDHEATHASAERRATRFHDEMQVSDLDREVDDLEAALVRTRLLATKDLTDHSLDHLRAE